MDLLPHLITYFRGERFNGMAMTIAGVIFLLILLLVGKQAAPASIARGLLFPLLFLVTVGAGAGPYFWWSGGQRLEQFQVELRADPPRFVAQEATRMEGVNRLWVPLKIMWTTLLIVGLFLAIRAGVPYWKGVGIGLLLIGTMGHVVDGFASDRAHRYTTALVNVLSR